MASGAGGQAGMSCRPPEACSRDSGRFPCLPDHCMKPGLFVTLTMVKHEKIGLMDDPGPACMVRILVGVILRRGIPPSGPSRQRSDCTIVMAIRWNAPTEYSTLRELPCVCPCLLQQARKAKAHARARGLFLPVQLTRARLTMNHARAIASGTGLGADAVARRTPDRLLVGAGRHVDDRLAVFLRDLPSPLASVTLKYAAAIALRTCRHDRLL
jgi:hypothetical protein